MHVRKSLDTASLMKASKLLGDKDYVVYDDWMMEADVDKIYNTFAWKPQQNLEEWVKKQIGK